MRTNFLNVEVTIVNAAGLLSRPHAAGGPVAHVHQWEHRPDQSDAKVTRYQCATCQRWGCRVWRSRGRHVPPILAYVAAVTEPKEKWGGEPWPQDVTAESAAADAHRQELEEEDEPALDEPEGWRWYP